MITTPLTTTITTTMTDDSALLTLTHWLSPVFPVGGYAYSQGLETAIADGAVTSADTLHDWLDVMLNDGTGASDAILLRTSMDADADLAELAAWAAALASSAERWQETSEQGTAFLRALATIDPDVLPSFWSKYPGESGPTGPDGAEPPADIALPVAVGWAARDLALPGAQVAALYLQSMVANLVTGAIRHIPLGQGAGQRVIAALRPVVLATAADAAGKTPADIRSSDFGAVRAAITHETQTIRIFRT